MRFLYFLKISRVQNASKNTKNNYQGIMFVTISCQRVSILGELTSAIASSIARIHCKSLTCLLLTFRQGSLELSKNVHGIHAAFTNRNCPRSCRSNCCLGFLVLAGYFFFGWEGLWLAGAVVHIDVDRQVSGRAHG